MDGCNLHGQQFLADKQVAQVSLCVDAVDEAFAILLDRGEIVGPFLVAHIHDAVGGEQHAVAPVAGGHNAIHHVDTTVDCFEYVGRCAHPHEVSWPVGWKDFVYHLDHVIHGFGRFAHGQAADGVAVGTQFRHSHGGFAAKSGYVHPCTMGKKLWR